MTGKKILMVHKHFLPDTPPYASMLHDIAEFLTREKHHISVYTAQPSYKVVNSISKSNEVLKNNIHVKRIRLFVTLLSGFSVTKYVDFVYFPFRVFLHIIFNKYDVVTVSTAPPVLLGYFAALACRLKRVNLIYHCMDIHPEIGSISGEFSNSKIFKMLRMLDNYTLRTAKKVIVLSSDMKNSLLNRNYSSAENITVINNFSLSDSCSNLANENINDFLKPASLVRLIFAGNIGRFQGLDSLVKAFNRRALNSKLELVFLGEGTALPYLKSIATHPNIRFFPHQSISKAKLIMRQSDYGIVSLQKEVIRYAYPSKTLTYMEQSLPIIALVEGDSELAEVLRKHQIGFSVENDSIVEIEKLLNMIEVSNQSRDEMKDSVKKYYKENHSKQKVFAAWKGLIEEM